MLVAIKEGKVEELKVVKRRSSLSESEWPQRIAAALMLSENVRFNPGASSVSLSYGRRAPKIFMEKSKLVFVKELQEYYKELDPAEHCFCRTSLLSLIPGNYRQTKEADRENNICPKHSNLSHLLKKVRPVVPSLPSSSTEIAGLAMCSPSAAQPFTLHKPLTWRKECALRYC